MTNEVMPVRQGDAGVTAGSSSAWTIATRDQMGESRTHVAQDVLRQAASEVLVEALAGLEMSST